MSLEEKVMSLMKDAMKSKDEATLRGLRAIKAEIIKAKTDPGANGACLLYTSPSPRDYAASRMPSSA